MGAKTAISVEEYLRTSFPDLDKEYRDGELEERSLPDDPHSATQALLTYYFMLVAKRVRLFVRPDLRLKLRTGLYLIPDVSIYYPNPPGVPVPDHPPLIAVEILSPDERLHKLREKLEEYKAWGVPHVWVVDPHSRRLYTCDSGLFEVNSLRVPELDIELGPADVFEE